MNNLWISNSILDWELRYQSANIFDHEWERAYTIWAHACNLIEDSRNDFSLSDGIGNLKRSLNHRLKLIEELYCFKSIEIPNKPKGYLELLERYDIVRPYLMKMLLDVRNDIEHNDAVPPALEKCKELVDVVWYFLKSTDSIIRVQKDSFIFNLLDETGSDTDYWISLDVNFKSGSKDFKIYGNIPCSMLYRACEKGASKVVIEKSGETNKNIEDYCGNSDTKISISGVLIPSPAMRLYILKKLLKCY